MTDKAQLAHYGGPKVRREPFPTRGHIGAEEKAAVDAFLDGVIESGALRVVPGSHKLPFHQEVRGTIKRGKLDILTVPSYVCESQPGDVAAFDLRLWHASWSGSARRRMCTFVYYNNPADPVAEAASRKRAAGFVTMNAYFGRPDEPIYHPAGLGNRSGSPLRQRWIHRLDELGFLASPATAKGE